MLGGAGVNKTGFEKYPELYGSSAWRSLRKQAFERDGYECCLCHRLTSNPIADHRAPHNGNRELFFNLDNVQTLCPSCHSGIKRMQETHGYSAACDENGRPVDKNHPWNRR
jgi:hypothetical protein